MSQINKWSRLVIYLQQLSASPQFWRLAMVTLASVGGSIYSLMKLKEYWENQQSGTVQRIRLQDLPTDIDRLKAICLEKLQENKALADTVANRDRELTTQRQSLANLALTVVKQDRHIKALLAHMDMQPMDLLQECHNQLDHELNNVSNSYVPHDKASVSGLSGGLTTESGIFDNFDDSHHQQNSHHESVHLWSLPNGDNNHNYNYNKKNHHFYPNEFSIDEEDDEVSQLKMQIMEANDFLNDLATEDEDLTAQMSRTDSNGTNLSSSVSNLSRPLRKKPYQSYQRWNTMPNRSNNINVNNGGNFGKMQYKHTASTVHEQYVSAQNSLNMQQQPLRKKPYQQYQRWNTMPNRSNNISANNGGNFGKMQYKHTASTLHEQYASAQNSLNMQQQ